MSKIPLDEFVKAAEKLVHDHPIVQHNHYTTWFSTGKANTDQVKYLTQQFSVFSHLFIEAQLRKVINAQTLDSYRMSKEILMNELGVSFKTDKKQTHEIPTEGSVEGSKYHHSAAHFEWLLRFAEPLGLTFQDLGKPWLANAETKHFCAELSRIYGNPDPSVAEGASYAVENWAAAGFWKQLIKGFEAYKEQNNLPLNLGFWKWHDMVEDQHAEHTHEELIETYNEEWFNADKFLQGAQEILQAVAIFWEGLEKHRKNYEKE